MKKVIWLPVILLIAFIFFNSSMDAETSSKMSGPIAELIQSLLQLTDGIIPVEFLIRKAAHFSEYALLGILVMTAQKQSPLSIKPSLVYSLFLVIPIIDENIQRFSLGRSCETRDMMIDACGYLFGLIIYQWSHYHLKRRKNHV